MMPKAVGFSRSCAECMHVPHLAGCKTGTIERLREERNRFVEETELGQISERLEADNDHSDASTVRSAMHRMRLLRGEIATLRDALAAVALASTRFGTCIFCQDGNHSHAVADPSSCPIGLVAAALSGCAKVVSVDDGRELIARELELLAERVRRRGVNAAWREEYARHDDLRAVTRIEELDAELPDGTRLRINSERRVHGF